MEIKRKIIDVAKSILWENGNCEHLENCFYCPLKDNECSCIPNKKANFEYISKWVKNNAEAIHLLEFENGLPERTGFITKVVPLKEYNDLLEMKRKLIEFMKDLGLES